MQSDHHHIPRTEGLGTAGRSALATRGFGVRRRTLRSIFFTTLLIGAVALIPLPGIADEEQSIDTVDTASAAAWLDRARPAAPEQAPPDRIVAAGQTLVLSGTHRFGLLRVEDGGRIEVDDYRGRPPDGSAPGGRLEIRADRIVIEAGGQISADAAGFRGLRESKGEGPGGGEGGINAFDLGVAARTGNPGPLHPTSSGAGGGHGGRGGDGVQDGKRGAWKGGQPYGAQDEDVRLGSGGGAAPASHHEPLSLRGGDGGGAIVLVAEDIRIEGRVSAEGEEGEAAEFDAGGGGSGGGIRIEAVHLSLSGNVSVRGGRGGRASNVGGSGAGGRIWVTWAEGKLDLDRFVIGPGLGPCPEPGVEAPRACAGELRLNYEGPRIVFLPFLGRRACIGPNRKAIALVMDVSGSMAEPTRAGRPAIDAAIEAAQTFLDRLTDEDRVALVAFDETARRVTALTADLSAVRAGLAGLVSDEGSRLDRGLLEGRTALADARASERPVLILLTDGRPSLVEAEAVRSAASSVLADGIRIYALGIGAEVDRTLLDQITGDPSHVLVESDAEDLDALYRAIAEREGCPLP